MNLEHARRLFQITTFISLLILTGLWLVAPPWSYEAWGYPILGIYLLWVIAALAWTSIRVERVLSLSHMVVSIFWLGLLTFRLFTTAEPSLVTERVTPDVYLLFVLLSIMAYLIFSTQIALKASLGLLLSTALLIGAWFSWAELGGRSVLSIGHVWMYVAIVAVAIVMLHVLARSKDRHAGALLEAARMRHMAYTDTLTSLPNRRELEERLEHTVVAANALEQPLSVVFFDLDDFKGVNDAHGHEVGDDVLTQVGDALRSLLRSGDTFGRWGGEEYLIIAPSASHEQALELAERLRVGVESHEFTHGVRVTASFGVATTRENGDARTLLSRADERLYRAKRAGRNRVAGRNGAPQDGARSDGSLSCES